MQCGLFDKQMDFTVIKFLIFEASFIFPEKLIKMENNQAPQVSPHKINNFVYEEDNRIILDFGTNDDFGK